MKIAVAYDNNKNVFQHFGHTEQFKIYEVEDNNIVSSEILSSDGEGHSALAQLLENKNIDNTEGSGIGLSFCKKIINLHGGEIDFESCPQKGSKFWFFIPQQAVSTT